MADAILGVEFLPVAYRLWVNVASAAQKAVGPTVAANVRPTEVPMLGQYCPMSELTAQTMNSRSIISLIYGIIFHWYCAFSIIYVTVYRTTKFPLSGTFKISF